MKKQIKKLLGVKRTIRSRRMPVMPLFVIAVLMVGVAGSLIYHYTVDVDTTGGEVLGDPYWTKFTNMSLVEVDTVPLPDVVQNSYAETDHYLLSLVNSLIEVEMVYTVTGAGPNTGVTVDCHVIVDTVDTIWQEGDDYAILMGNTVNPALVELYWNISVSYDAVVGESLGLFGFRFVAAEQPIVPFNMAIDMTGYDLFDPSTTSIDFGVITQGVETPSNILQILESTTDLKLLWSGVPEDIDIRCEISQNGGAWLLWDEAGHWILNDSDVWTLRFVVTAGELAIYPDGLTVSIDFFIAP